MKKKIISLTLAFFIFVLTLSSLAYNAPGHKNNTQFDLISLSVIDMPSTATGVRDYKNIIASKKKYKANDPILVAIDLETKNIAVNPNLQSIGKSEIELVIGSSSIDFSTSRASKPVLISDAYEWIKDKTILKLLSQGDTSAITKTVLDITKALEYDKNDNLIMFHMQGSNKNAQSFTNPKEIAPKIINNKIQVAAISAKDGKQGLVINNRNIDFDFDAPDKINYKIIVSGIAKSSSRGEIFSSLKILGNETFQRNNNQLKANDQYNVYKNIVFADEGKDDNQKERDQNVWVKVQDKIVAQIKPKVEDNSLGESLASEKTYSHNELMTNIDTNNTDGGMDEQNGIAVYTICNKDDRPIVSVISENIDSDEGESLVMFMPDDGRGYARRIGSAIGGNLVFLDEEGGNVPGARSIVSALRYFGLNTSLNDTYKINDKIFEKKTNRESVGTVLNSSYFTFKGNKRGNDKEKIEDNVFVEEEKDDILFFENGKRERNNSEEKDDILFLEQEEIEEKDDLLFLEDEDIEEKDDILFLEDDEELNEEEPEELPVEEEGEDFVEELEEMPEEAQEEEEYYEQEEETIFIVEKDIPPRTADLSTPVAQAVIAYTVILAIGIAAIIAKLKGSKK